MFYPPTLLTNVTSIKKAQEEIFGPVLVAMTFRTPAEAIELANNTRYGLAASVWSENINLALEAAHKIKAGTIWVNSTNLFDAASGFGGYRESGYGREGGKEGLMEYVRPMWQQRPRPQAKFLSDHAPDIKAWAKAIPAYPPPPNSTSHTNGFPPVDRTTKMYMGQAKTP
jgi:aldehyde dehydrogenase (NAD+)